MAFNGRFILNMAHLAGSKGADVSALVRVSGKSMDELCAEDCFIEDEAYNAVVNLAVEQTGDLFFGLHAAENLNIAAAGLIAQITQTSSTVKEALEYCCEFANLGCSSLPMKLVERDSDYCLELIPDPVWRSKSENSYRHTADGIMAFTIKEFHSLTRNKHYPIRVDLTWQRPINAKEYDRVFKCELKFDQPILAMYFKKEDIEEKILTSDFNLLRVLVAHAEEKNAALETEKGFVSVVKRSVMNLVKPEFPTIDQVASHLNLSVRTLQRRLTQENQSYKSVIDELRKDFALSYLKNPELNINDIAYLLSYADASAFIRSFKRWTGETPSQYRTS